MHQASPRFAAFIGIDWADKKHDVCLHVPGQKKRASALARMDPGLLARTDPRGLGGRFVPTLRCG